MPTIDVLLRTKRKSVSLHITPQGNLVVRAPLNCPYSQILDFVNKKQRWIELHQQRIKNTMELNQNLFNYKNILFFGDTYNVILSDVVKTVTLNRGSCLIPLKTPPEQVRVVLEKFLRKTAESIITERIRYFSNLMQLSPSRIRLINAKTCWGTCNRQDVVSINWRAVMLPHALIDYLIVHELSHILEFNHSKRFWQVVASVIPDFKTRRNQLKMGDYLLRLFRD